MTPANGMGTGRLVPVPVPAGKVKDRERQEHTCTCGTEIIPVGLVEIAVLTGLKRVYLDTLRHRGKFPAPEFQIGGRPAWRPETVSEWMARRAPRPTISAQERS